MAAFTPTPGQLSFVEELVAHYQQNQGPIKRSLDSLHSFIPEAEALRPLIHSVKHRMKDPSNLRDKLLRKLKEAHDEGSEFDISQENLFMKINDLGGYRILHLHTTQVDQINKALLKILQDEAQFSLIEGPKANVWDKESESYFQSIGITVEYNPRLYSSVHYIIQPNNKAKVTLEIQVRTLSEEIWGEVDHKFNYPHSIDSVACREQIRVLARLASSCSRLVDSIFASHADWNKGKTNQS
ncbi:MAG TPA: RelA/SpoT domain-containing protein [Candidatus Baltobacteraceae bacterium]|jgi:putative GTP pyrophosphokinase|nr:RelA/SpoT domain-containing protein [Candidatus Baltobacteraceae bacterium]